MPHPNAPALTLYYSPGACSLAAHIALRESGLAFDARPVLIAKGEHLAPAYLAINPRGRIPTLVIDGTPVTELSAILGWIAERAPQLAPPPGTLASAQFAEWLGWFTSAVHISFALVWRGSRFLERKELHPELRATGIATLQRQFADIESRLARHEYLVDGGYSVADANVLVFYRWANRIGLDTRTDYPAWTRHTERLLQRPAVSAAVAAEGIEIWARPDA